MKKLSSWSCLKLNFRLVDVLYWIKHCFLRLSGQISSNLIENIFNIQSSPLNLQKPVKKIFESLRAERRTPLKKHRTGGVWSLELDLGVISEWFQWRTLWSWWRTSLNLQETRITSLKKTSDWRGSTPLSRIECCFWMICTKDTLELLRIFKKSWRTHLKKISYWRELSTLISDRTLFMDDLHEERVWSSFESSPMNLCVGRWI